jgi:hypothetical protein
LSSFWRINYFVVNGSYTEIKKCMVWGKHGDDKKKEQELAKPETGGSMLPKPPSPSSILGLIALN